MILEIAFVLLLMGGLGLLFAIGLAMILPELGDDDFDGREK